MCEKTSELGLTKVPLHVNTLCRKHTYCDHLQWDSKKTQTKDLVWENFATEVAVRKIYMNSGNHSGG